MGDWIVYVGEDRREPLAATPGRSAQRRAAPRSSALAEHAGLLAGRRRTRRRRFRKQAAIGRILVAIRVGPVRANGCQRSVEHTERTGDQSFLREITRIGDEIARGEIVGAVENHVVIFDEIQRIGRWSSNAWMEYMRAAPAGRIARLRQSIGSPEALNLTADYMLLPAGRPGKGAALLPRGG